jgi:Homeodomain
MRRKIKIEFLVESTQFPSNWCPLFPALRSLKQTRSFSSSFSPSPFPSFPLSPSPPQRIMLLGDPSDTASPSFSAPAPASHRSYIPSLIPPGVDPAKVDSKMFYTYVPNTIKTRKRTTPAQLEILEGVFVTDKKPNAPRRKELAKKLKMSPREVQVRVFHPVSPSSRPLKHIPHLMRKGVVPK